MTVSMSTAAAIGLLLLLLSIRITAIRRADRISMGDGGNPELVARMRAQANCAEYAPITLILLALAEWQGGTTPFIIAMGILLVVSRILHPIGMAMAAPNAPRVIGTLGTWAALVLLAGANLWAAISALPVAS